jgi:hypothetical protein
MQQVPPARRTTVQVQRCQDPWPLIAGSAAHHEYEAAGLPFEGMMVYQRGWGATKPHLVAFHIEHDILAIQACIRFSGLERLRSLFILPAEINIGSGELRRTRASQGTRRGQRAARSPRRTADPVAAA